MEPIGVAVVGFGWMGQVHARAYARVHHHSADLGLVPQLRAVTESEPAQRAVPTRYGTPRVVPDWRELLAADDVRLVSVTVPNFLHREIACAFAKAGKHLWLEKPVGVGVADAAEVDAARVQCTVGVNYRLIPAVVHARTHPRRRHRRTHARAVPAAVRLRRTPGCGAVLAVRTSPWRGRRAGRPGLTRCRSDRLPAR